MQRYFSSVARLYRRVVELAAQVFAAAPPESATEESASLESVKDGSTPASSASARRRVANQPAASLDGSHHPVVPPAPANPPSRVMMPVQPPAKDTPPPTHIDPALARLIKELRAADGMTRPKVAKRIQGHGPAAVPALISLVSDGEWPMRYWAAHLLKDFAEPAALPALQWQLPLETDRVVKEEITKAIQALRIFKAPVTVTPQQLAALPVGMQGRLDELRRELVQAYQGRDVVRAERLQQHLVTMQVELCERLRGAPLPPPERQRLLTHYLRVSARGRLRKRTKETYQNTCWVCRADVDSRVNQACSCGWLICVCGACQCPDFSIGRRDHQPECQQQIARFGLRRYHELIEERQRLFGGWSRFARADFSS